MVGWFNFRMVSNGQLVSNDRMVQLSNGAGRSNIRMMLNGQMVELYQMAEWFKCRMVSIGQMVSNGRMVSNCRVA
jgi:hypothetical protein